MARARQPPQLCPMRQSPSIVPPGGDQDVYLVLDDFGSDGRAWSEADVEHTDLERL